VPPDVWMLGLLALLTAIAFLYVAALRRLP
jgi:hypothetical protein